MPRDVWKPNVTVGAVIERDGRFLLIEEEAQGRVVLNQPAGHWEQGESLVEACVREVMEESAYHFAPTALLGIYHAHAVPEDVTYLRFAFVGRLGARDPARELDRGIRGVVWLSAAELQVCAERHRTPVVMRCVEDYLAGRRYPLELLTSLS